MCVNRCVIRNLFRKTLEKIGYLSIRTQGSQWTDSLRGWGNLSALTTDERETQTIGWDGVRLTQHQ